MGRFIKKVAPAPVAAAPVAAAPVVNRVMPLAPPPPPPPPPGANTPVAQQSTIPTTSTATGLPGVQGSTTVPQTQKLGMQQQIPPYLLQELLMGARYNNPYMSGVSGPYQAPQIYQQPQYAGLQNIAPWAMPQNPSMYGGGFLGGGAQMQPNNAQFNLQPQYGSAPNMNSLLSSFLGAWR